MTPDFDNSDPLQLLMAEWHQTGWWLWIFLGLAAVVLFAYPGTPELSLLVAGVGVGQALLKLGSVAIVVANELRKELRTSPRAAPNGDQEPLR